MKRYGSGCKEVLAMDEKEKKLNTNQITLSDYMKERGVSMGRITLRAITQALKAV